MNFSRKALYSAISLILLSSPQIHADIVITIPEIGVNQVSVTGVAGLNGAHGSEGVPGGDGTDGGDAQAIANSGAKNRAEAIGGAGGHGGSVAWTPVIGEDGLPIWPVFVFPGTGEGEPMDVPIFTPGGAAGKGGSASASADSAGASGNVIAEAIARGGQSGSPGVALYFPTSLGDPAPMPPHPTPDGGSATATATGAASGDAQQLTVKAAAGGGGAGPKGYIDVPSMGLTRIYSHGGPGSGNGGSATSSATGTATNGIGVSVIANALGGWGADNQSIGGVGGQASASAQASSTGFGSVYSEAAAIGGAGGGTQDGAQAHAQASGSSSDGWVTVIATQTGGRGGDGGYSPTSSAAGAGAASFMDNQVSGSTRGDLTLIQRAEGGAGGDANGFSGWAIPGKGGDAQSLLEKTNDGLSLRGETSAVGGNGGGGPQGALGGSANANTHLINSGSVDAKALAQGGMGGGTATFGSGIAGQGGGATATAYGESTGGGNVSATVAATGGNGGYGPNLYENSGPGPKMGGNGAAVSLENAVDGKTSGVLSLNQTATGGNGGSSEAGPGGAGGQARSLLAGYMNEQASALIMNVQSVGGSGYSAQGNGDAYTEVSGASTSGAVTIIGDARGGNGLGEGQAKGGNATNILFGATAFDGQSVQVVGMAFGGSSALDPSQGTAGQGGQAHSVSEGMAVGNSEVRVYDQAVGGAGTHGYEISATSDARASNEGSSSLVAVANAIGGQGLSVGGSSGSARATARADSLGGGDATAQAFQSGGAGVAMTANGASSSMSNQVSGSTSGLLTLGQFAKGGDGGAFGSGGDAESNLSILDDTSGELRATVQALGGNAFGQEGFGNGGTAVTELILSSRGPVTANGYAAGGDTSNISGSGFGPVAGGAQNEVSVRSTGEGAAVTVVGEARGGSGYGIEGGAAGSAGNAFSSSSGRGKGIVSVTDTARSGTGGDSWVGSMPPGASAFSQANAVTESTQRATSSSTAQAEPAGIMSMAWASSKASSQGGTALATSKASGADSLADASASTQSQTGIVRSVSAFAQSQGRGQTQATALARIGDLDAVPGPAAGNHSTATAVGAPAAEVVDALMAGTRAAELVHLGEAEALGVGGLSGQIDSSTEAFRSSVSYRFDTGAWTSSDHLTVGFSEPLASGGVYGDNKLLVNVGGVSIFEWHYQEGVTGLGNQVFDLGNWYGGPWGSAGLDVELVLIMSGADELWPLPEGESMSFSINYLIGQGPSPVPVPAAAWLFGSGLMGLAAWRRRSL